MQLYYPLESSALLELPLLRFKFPAGFPSPAADYSETRIDLNRELIKNPSFTFFAVAEGDSMFPLIQDSNLLVVDRKVDQPNGCVILASVNNAFCVKHLYRFPDGSIELRPHNLKHESIFLPSEFEGEFQIFGRVVKAIQDIE
ncbi:translesion error-prone DNA polymerase V autoproteolytic subunit [soil metagenome]